MKNKNSQNFFLNSEKRENIAFFNLIFLILIIFSFSVFSIFDAKNQFYSKNSSKKSSKNFVQEGQYKEINVNFLNHNQNSGPDQNFEKSLISESYFFISDNFGKLLLRLKDEFFFEDSRMKELIAFSNSFKSANGDLFSSEAFGILDKSRNLIEIRVKIDDFRFLKITKNSHTNNKNDSEFEVKKIFTKTYISDLRDVATENFSSENEIINSPNFQENSLNSDLIEFIGLNSSSNKNLFFVEENFSDYQSLKNLLLNLNLSKENLNHLLNAASSSVSKKENKGNVKKISGSNINDSKKIAFKGLFVVQEKDNRGGAQLRKISYEKNDGSLSSVAQKKELIYFSLNNKSYYLFKKDGVSAYYDSFGNSLHSKKMFGMPLAGAYRISSNFGIRFHPVLKYTRMHNGVDLAIRHGHPVKAPANGTVKFAGRRGGYGNYLLINHGGGYKTGYGHLSRFEKKIRPGQVVSKNQLIAYVGNTGTSSGPHLHYEIIKNNRFVDPLKNNPNVSERLDKNEIRKFKKLIEMINSKIIEQKKAQEYEAIINERLNKKKVIDKV